MPTTTPGRIDHRFTKGSCQVHIWMEEKPAKRLRCHLGARIWLPGIEQEIGQNAKHAPSCELEAEPQYFDNIAAMAEFIENETKRLETNMAKQARRLDIAKAEFLAFVAACPQQ